MQWEKAKRIYKLIYIKKSNRKRESIKNHKYCSSNTHPVPKPNFHREDYNFLVKTTTTKRQKHSQFHTDRCLAHLQQVSNTPFLVTKFTHFTYLDRNKNSIGNNQDSHIY